MLRIRPSGRKGSYFRMLLFSYLVLFIIPLLVIVIVFNTYVTPAVYKKDVDYSYKILVHIVNATDLVLDEVNVMALNCAVNDNFQKMININLKKDIFLISQISEQLSDIKNTNDNLYSVYLYIRNNDKIMDSSKGFYDVSDFYDSQWLERYDSGGRGTQIYSRVVAEPSLSTNSIIRTNVISLIVELKNKTGAIVFNIRESAFRDILQQLSGGDDKIFVMDRQGAIISQYDTDSDVDGASVATVMNSIIGQEGSGYFITDMEGEEKLVSYVESSRYDWVYASVASVTSLKKTSLEMTLIVLMVSILCIIIGIGGAFAFSRRIYSPVEVLLSNLRQKSLQSGDGSPNNINEFNYINSTINEIISREESMEEILSSSSKLAREQFLQKLVKGEISDAAEIETQMERLDIRFQYDCFSVMTIEFDDWGKLSFYMSKKDIIKAKEYMKDLIKKDLADEKFNLTALSFELRKIVLIVNVEDGGNQDDNSYFINDIAANVKKELESSQGSTVSIGVGECVKSVGDLFKSYYQSCNALNYIMLYGRNRIFHIGDIRRGKNVNCLDMYRAEFNDSDLMEMVMGLRAQDIIEQFDKTVERLTALGADQMYIKFLFLQYIGMISRVPFELGIESLTDIVEESYKNAIGYESIEDMKACVVRVTNGIIEAYRIENEGNNIARIVEDAIEYIRTNYSRDISLEQVAEKVYVSKYYLSRIFKIKSGINFNEYLNRIRIQKAKELLEKTDDDINAIARKVGYDASNSFGRMFKRKVGVSPSQYRDSHHKNGRVML